MFDILGVGLCIACISYLCCIYTTTFTTLTTPFDSRKRRKRTRCQTYVFPNSESRIPIGINSQHRCPCLAARYIERELIPEGILTVPSRRKICLIATSFLDFDDMELHHEGSGKCDGNNKKHRYYINQKNSTNNLSQRGSKQYVSRT